MQAVSPWFALSKLMQGIRETRIQIEPCVEPIQGKKINRSQRSRFDVDQPTARTCDS